MPELPEVEVTRRGIAPYLEGCRVASVVLRTPGLRWPLPEDLARTLEGATIRTVSRRGKYLLLDCGHGTLILHLGMSGSLRVLHAALPPRKHDHVDLVLATGAILRFHDPRRFGAMLWSTGDVMRHALLARLGPEPLAATFTGRLLYEKTRGRTASIKQILMNSQVVVGVGNIYASEALFAAGIDPTMSAGRIGLRRYGKLVEAIKETLSLSIAAGGSTLRDFVDSTGNPGYFQQCYWVYRRGGQPCRRCGTAIRHIRQGQRSSFYCPHCQR